MGPFGCDVQNSELRTANSISQFYNITLARVNQILDFLVHTGLAKQNKNVFETGVQI